MQCEPKVTVCVLTYNHERYIRQCLQSIVDQKTDFLFEVIVADDCSRDGTPAIVQEFAESYPKLVKAVLRAVNIGGTRNYIDLHNRAQSIYVAHIDGDDLMLPGKLQKQADFLDANPDFTVVWHRINLIEDDGHFISGENYPLALFLDGVVTFEHCLRLGSVGAHSAMMYRRSARKTRETNFATLDLFYAWEFLSSGKGKILMDVLGSYRASAQTSIQLKSALAVQRAIAHHLRYYLRLFPEQRRNVFVLAFINFMVEAKNLRPTAWEYGCLAVRSFSLVSPRLIVKTISETWQLPTCSPLASTHIAAARRSSGVKDAGAGKSN